MKNWSRKKNRIMCLVAALLIVFNFCSFSITSFAADLRYPYYVGYYEPSTDTGNGYLTLLLLDKNTGGYSVETFFFTTAMTDNSLGDLATSGYFTLTSMELQFSPYGLRSGDFDGTYSLYRYDSSNKLYHLKTSGTESCIFSYSNKTIVAWQCNGDVVMNELVANSNNNQMFKVVFLGDIDGGRIDIALTNIEDFLEGLGGGFGGVTDAINSWNRQIYNLMYDSMYPLLVKMHSEWTPLFQSMEKNLGYIISRLNGWNNLFNGWRSDMNTKLDTIVTKLDDFFSLEGQESTEPLPDDEVSNVIESEGELVQDTTDAENNLNFSIDSNSNSVVWNIMERVLNANEKVFGAFIGIMTLGVVTLLLNR